MEDKVQLVKDKPAAEQSAPEEAPPILRGDATKKKVGSKWIDALLANPDELATETQTRFRAVDTTGHVVSGGDGLVEPEEALALISGLCDELGMVT